jgi:2-dehydropantoate 2-reductase
LLAPKADVPPGEELVITFDPVERIVTRRRLTHCYTCGQPGCLVDLLRRHGDQAIRGLLELAQRDLLGALDRIPADLEPRGRQQLLEVIELVARDGGLPGAGGIIRQWVVLQPHQRPGEPAGLTRWARGESCFPVDGKRVLVVGAGAVGCLLAARLQLAGHPVVLVGRPEQVAAIRDSGLQVQDGSQTLATRPAAIVASLEEAFVLSREYDLSILAVKAYDLQEVLGRLASTPGSLPRAVMTPQSGVGAEESAAETCGPQRVLAAALTIPVTVVTRGSVAVDQPGRGLALAPYLAGEPVDEWVALFQEAGFAATGHPEHQAIKWSKLFASLAANATCAVLARKPAVIYRHAPTFALERAMLRETLAVIKALEVPLVDLPGTPIRPLARVVQLMPAGMAQSRLAAQLERERREKMPLLYLDLAAGKPSEVSWLNGAVAEAGRLCHVPTPVNRVLDEVLNQITAGTLPWDDFRGKPQALLARVRATQGRKGT